jgi:hypothetical protein
VALLISVYPRCGRGQPGDVRRKNLCGRRRE